MDYPCKDCKTAKALYACEQSTCKKYKEYKQGNADYIKLAQIAYDAVIQTMLEGEKKYPNEKWKQQSIKAHCIHAYEHADSKYMDVIYEEQPKEDDIAHMITRGAMIKYLEGDNK